MPSKYLLLVLFLVLMSANVFAQNGRYDLRLVQESADCAARKVTFVAQIRASAPDSAFILGSASLPFSFSGNALSNPVLSSADNYSGGRYGTLTLDRQSQILTLSAVYNGTAPFTDTVNVTANWTDIAHITFDVASQTDGCYTLAWNGPAAFPSVEVFQIVPATPATPERPALSGTFTDAVGCAFATQLPTAVLSGDTTIAPGGEAKLKVTFAGPPPTSVSIGGTVYNNLSQSPLTVSFFPDRTTTYTIDSVSNACGRGTASGSARVTIAAQPLPDTIATQNLTADTICRNSEVLVAFTTNANFNSANAFKVQLSDANGANFTDISSTSTASLGPLSATIPANIAAGSGYRLRVVSTGPGIVGTPSAAFVIAPAPTATLTGDATIVPGGSADLTVNFTGRAPWTVVLSNGTQYTSSASSLTIDVSPTETTSYTLRTLQDACTEGSTSGSATVTVQPQPDACNPLCVPATAVVINK